MPAGRVESSSVSTTTKDGGSPDALERVVIIGSGPAGWTAAIYAARANLDPVCFVGLPKSDPAPVLPGGQLMLTTEVENYPGFPEGVTGPEMMTAFQQQAERFGTRVMHEDIVSCDFSSRPFTLTTSDERTIRTRAVIIATGSELQLAVEAHEALLAQGLPTRVVSMPCSSLFDRQDAGYQDHVLPLDLPAVAIEAAQPDFWRKYVGRRGRVIGMTGFGESAPAGVLYQHFGITAEAVAQAVHEVIA